MKILIIGKNGQVGASLVRKAIEKNIEYVATDRGDLDITSEKTITSFFENQSNFDFVINAAAYTKVDAAEQFPDIARAANALSLQYLAYTLKKFNIPIIHLSTDYVFDGEIATNYKEIDAPNPQNLYGETKLEGENILKSIWDKHIILRVSWVFSEYGNNFVKTISRLCDEKNTLSIVADQYGSPTSASSIAEIILTICNVLQQNKYSEKYWGIYHYSDFPATNWYQFASYIAHIKEKNNKYISIHAIKTADYPTAAKRPRNSQLCNMKIKEHFAIRQKSWLPEVDRIISLLEENNAIT